MPVVKRTRKKRGQLQSGQPAAQPAQLPVHKHKTKIILFWIFTAVVLLGIVVFILFGGQIAGKAVHISTTGLTLYSAGVPLDAKQTHTLEVGKPEYFKVYANLGKDAKAKDGNVFAFTFGYGDLSLKDIFPRDASALSVPLDKTENGLIKGVTILDSTTNGDGTITVTGAVLETKSEGGKTVLKGLQDYATNGVVHLATLKIDSDKVPDDPSRQITFTKFEIYDKNEDAPTNIITAKVNPKFKVVKAPCKEGVTKCKDSATLQTCSNKAWKDSACGAGKICEVSSGIAKCVPAAAKKLGDVVGTDGKVNTGDAIQVLRYSLGLRSLTAEEKKAANINCDKDANGDDKINTGDAIQILRFSLGLRGELKCPVS